MTFKAYVQPVTGSNSKAYVDIQGDYRYACWSNGDLVKINSQPCSVSVSTPSSNTQQAVISGVNPSESGYYAFYPNNSNYISESCDETFTITLPDTLYYSENLQKQVLMAPMAAKADGDGVLKFYNLCTLLEVVIPESHAILKSIIVKSPSRYLAGPTSVSFSGNIPSLGAFVDDDNLSSQKVTMSFGSGLNVTSGKTVYIPVPAIGEGETLTIKLVNTENAFSQVQVVASRPVGANCIASIRTPQVPGLSGYETRAWIESRQSGYIDLGVKPKVGAKFELRFSLISGDGVDQSQYLCGSRGPNYEPGSTTKLFQWFTMTGSYTDTAFYATLCGKQVKNRAYRRQLGHIYVQSMEALEDRTNGIYGRAVFKDETSGLQNVMITDYYTDGVIPTGTSINNVILFGITPNNLHFGMRCYGFKYYENDRLIHDYVPCVRGSDRAVGMYDIIESIFIEPNISTRPVGAPSFTVSTN